MSEEGIQRFKPYQRREADDTGEPVSANANEENVHRETCSKKNQNCEQLTDDEDFCSSRMEVVTININNSKRR